MSIPTLEGFSTGLLVGSAAGLVTVIGSVGVIKVVEKVTDCFFGAQRKNGLVDITFGKSERSPGTGQSCLSNYLGVGHPTPRSRMIGGSSSDVGLEAHPTEYWVASLKVEK